ncbi:MAG: sigma-70 family RNA polymerase sigma factor [Fulvivirga sp.]
MESKPTHEDQRYIEALLENDSELIADIYDKWADKVVAYIKKNNGTEADARDIIQDTLIVIFRQASEKDLQLTCPFEAYFFLLCKRRWLNHLKENSQKEVTIDNDFTSIDKADHQMAASTEQFEQKQHLVKSQFDALSDKCKELISLTLEIKSMKTVAEKLGVSYAYVRKKKSLCMGQLTKLVRMSKAYKHINE